MKKVTYILILLISFHLYAQTNTEPKWKGDLRTFITKYFGEKWSSKLLGEKPEIAVVAELPMPEIPKVVKKSTDVQSYDKLQKSSPEYDKLPQEKKRQYDFNFIQELFRVTRKIEATEDDIANWLNTLDQGGSREGIYQALVLDETYFSLESRDEKPTEKLITFYISFSQKFLNQSLKAESIQKLNLFSLKRILGEKSLDLLEHFEIKDLDNMYKWYANFSAEAASSHSSSMTSEVRKNTSVKAHYQWAKDMPIQHIKSEFIIKLHSIMNDLQNS